MQPLSVTLTIANISMSHSVFSVYTQAHIFHIELSFNNETLVCTGSFVKPAEISNVGISGGCSSCGLKLLKEVFDVLKIKNPRQGLDSCQWLGVLPVLAEDPSLFPSTHIRRLTSACGSDALFWPPQTLHSHVQIHTQGTNLPSLKTKLKSL